MIKTQYHVIRRGKFKKYSLVEKIVSKALTGVKDVVALGYRSYIQHGITKTESFENAILANDDVLQTYYQGERKDPKTEKKEARDVKGTEDYLKSLLSWMGYHRNIKFLRVRYNKIDLSDEQVIAFIEKLRNKRINPKDWVDEQKVAAEVEKDAATKNEKASTSTVVSPETNNTPVQAPVEGNPKNESTPNQEQDKKSPKKDEEVKSDEDAIAVVTNLVNSKADLTSQVSNLTTENADLKTENADLTSQVSNLTTENANLVIVNKAFDTRIKNAEDAVKAMTSELDQLRAMKQLYEQNIAKMYNAINGNQQTTTNDQEPLDGKRL